MKHAGFDYRRLAQALNPDLLHRLPPRAGESTLFDIAAEGEGSSCGSTIEDSVGGLEDITLEGSIDTLARPAAGDTSAATHEAGGAISVFHAAPSITVSPRRTHKGQPKSKKEHTR